jgi:hypothetical protein
MNLHDSTDLNDPGLRNLLERALTAEPASTLDVNRVVGQGVHARHRRNRMLVTGTAAATAAVLVGGYAASTAWGGSADHQRSGVPTTPPVATGGHATATHAPHVNLNRPLTPEEHRIGDIVATRLEAALPAGTVVHYTRSGGPAIHMTPLPPMVLLDFHASRGYLNVAAAVYARDPWPDTAPQACVNPFQTCDVTDQGDGVLTQLTNVAWPGDVEASLSTGSGQRVDILQQAGGVVLAPLSAAEVDSLATDPALEMRPGTVGWSPYADWSGPDQTTMDTATRAEQQRVGEAARAGLADVVAGTVSAPLPAVESDDTRITLYDEFTTLYDVNGDVHRSIAVSFARGTSLPLRGIDCGKRAPNGIVPKNISRLPDAPGCSRTDVPGGYVIVNHINDHNGGGVVGSKSVDAAFVTDGGYTIASMDNFDPLDAGTVGDFPMTEQQLVQFVQGEAVQYR